MPFTKIDTRPLWVIAARTVLPALFGALGAMTATIVPWAHQAFCARALG